MSTFGRIFRVTTFGESHCKAVGGIVDGCPANLPLTEQDIQPQLTRRRPGQSSLTTPRDEADTVTILSGTERGITLGTPIGFSVDNTNVRPGDYKEMDTIPRPGHADYTYQMKYGNRASSGGGRASARETIGRVAAGAIAETWLAREYGTEIVSWVSSIGPVSMPESERTRKYTREEVDSLGTLELLRPQPGWHKATKSDLKEGETQAKAQVRIDQAAEEVFLASVAANTDSEQPAYLSKQGEVLTRDGTVLGVTAASVEAVRSGALLPLRCPHAPSAAKMATEIRVVKSQQDSTGGTVTGVIRNLPIGLGEPCFDKFEAMLAHAMLSLPATKGFEIGTGFAGTALRGSQHNDPFALATDGTGYLTPVTNNAGGTLGGITSGAEIVFRVAVKPVSTIGQAQHTATYEGVQSVLEAKGRHDPCVLPRTPPLIEAMAALVAIDAALIQRTRMPFATTTNTEEPTAKRARKE